MDPVGLTTSGPLVLAAGVALLAGAISFASPCVVPLVPGYLAYLAGLVGADAPAVDADEARGRGRFRVAGAAALFVLGFTVVFAAGLLGVVWLADHLLADEAVLQRVGGVITIAMGLVFVGLVPMLQRDTRPHRVPAARTGLIGAPLLGAVFGLGWTPCLGPTLTGVTAVAAGTGGGSLRGLLLVLAYCAGLGVPFVLLALGARRALAVSGWLRRHVRAVQLVGGGLLVLLGVALVTGLWGGLISLLRTPIGTWTLPL
jgi:cytochrome c-type biogenesis protein